MHPALPAKALIGMIHVQALPGAPFSRHAVREIVQQAAEEAAILARAGFDAIVIENMHDRPYVHGRHGPEVVAAMTAVGLAVSDAASSIRGSEIPLGVQVLSGGNREALAVALATGAVFIRCENFVFAHIADEGLLPEAEAGSLLRYRNQIGAEHVQVFADIKKKHASHAITADVPIKDAAEAARFFGADGLIVTGPATGRACRMEDLLAVARATELPVLVGSGVTPETCRDLLEHADGLIVGSAIKQHGFWENPPDPGRCEAMAAAVRDARSR
jgi:uncharacterized protein